MAIENKEAITMEFALALIAVVLLLSPLYVVYRRHVRRKPVKSALFSQIGVFFSFLILSSLFGISALAEETAAAAVTASPQMGLGMIAAALATGLSGIGGGIAVAAAASAALGAISENEKTFGKALIFVALAEGIALYGLIISFMILNKF